MSKTDLATVPDAPASIMPADSMDQILVLAEKLGPEGAETIARLSEIQAENLKVQARAAFHRAMARFHEVVPEIEKTSRSGASGSGNRFSYSYAKFDHIMRTIRPALAECGLSVRFKGELSDDQKFITQTCIVSHVLGHSEDSSFRGPIDSGSMNAIQKVGSGRSYANRYALIDALGLATCDPDTDGVVKPRKPMDAVSLEQALQLEARCTEAAEHKGMEPGVVLDRMLKWASASSPETFPKGKFAPAMEKLDGMFK